MILNSVRKEFVAKLIGDLGKTIFAVGLASYLFERFPIGVRIALFIGCVLFLVWSIFIHPKER